MNKALQRFLCFITGNKTFKYFDWFQANLSLSRQEMVELQNRLVRKIIRHAYHHTQYYRELMDSLSICPENIQSGDDLRKLPILSKSIIRQNIEKLKSDDPYSRNLREYTSSGSTGNQAVIYKSNFYKQMSRAVSLRSRLLAGWDMAEKSYWFWNDIYLHERISKNPLLWTVMGMIFRVVIVNAVNITTEDCRRFAQQIKKFRPRVLYGNARIITGFARYVMENSIQFESVELVVTTVEKLDNRELLEKAFHCPAHDYYGSTECCGIAVEAQMSGRERLRVSDDAYVVNFYDNNEIIVTALHSYGFPLINYQIGDYGVGCNQTASQEDSLPLSTMSIEIGRTTDLFLTRDRRFININAVIMDLARLKLNTKEQQFMQTDFDMIINRYVPDRDFNADYERIVYGKLKKYFGDDLKMEFHEVDEIPFEKSGKKLYCKRTFLLEWSPGRGG